MPLTPAEEKELAQLEAEVGGLTPEEEQELAQLETEFSGALTPEEEAELAQLEAEQPSGMEAFARGAAQGITMGFADEIVGAIESLASDKTYEQAREESRAAFKAAEEAHPKTTLAADIVGSLLMPVPGVTAARGATTAGKAAVKAATGAAKVKKAAMTGAALGAVEGLGRSEGKSVEEVAKDTLLAAGFGGGVGAGLAKAGAGIAKWNERTRKEMSRRQAAIVEGAQKYIDDIEVTDDALASHIANRSVKGDAAKEVIEKAKAENALAGHTERFKYKEAAQKYIRNDMSKEALAENKELTSFTRWALDFFSDSQFVYQNIDDKWGTTLTPTLNNLSGPKYNAYTFEMANVHEKTEGLKKLFKKATVSSEEVFDHINYGKPLRITNESDRAIVEETKRIFEDMRLKAEELGLPIKELTQEGQKAGYVTNSLVDKVQYRTTMEDKLDEALSALDEDALRRAGKEELEDMISENQSLSDLVRGLNIVTDTPIDRGWDIFKAINDLYQPRSVADTLLTSKASALLRREDKIPDFLLEKDLTKLMNRWASNTYRHALFRDEIEELTTNMLVLKEIDPMSSKYIERHINNMLGRPTGVGSLTDDIQTKMLSAATKAKSPAMKKAYEVAASIPNAGRYLQSQIYANFLGVNPRAVMRNLTQSAVMTAPEMAQAGPKAAARVAKYTLKGYSELAGTLKGKGMFSNKAVRESAIGKELEANNWLPQQFVGEGRDLIRQELLQNSGLVKRLGSGAKDWIDKGSEWAMAWYEKSDLLNRAATLRMSKELAKDFLAKDEVAKSIVDVMPRGYRVKIDRALKAGNDAEVGRLIADHFLASTQFNYNKLALSEFGRTFGPIFSIFSKWPTSIAGDIIAKARRDGVILGGGKAMIKYGAPWGVLAVADSMFEIDETKFGKRLADPTARELVGAKGFEAWAPIGSAKSVVTGEVFTPPAIAAAKGFVNATTSDKPHAFQKYMGNQAQAFTPGGWLYRLFADDVPHYVGKETK